MSKKTAKEAAAAPNAAAAPQSTEATPVQLPCAQLYFFTYAKQCWNNCAEYPTEFAEESDLYTPEFIDAQLRFVEAIELLPNNEIRVNEASEANKALEASRQPIVQDAERLRIAIRNFYGQPALVETELKLAGIAAFTNTSPSDWGATSNFITTASNYLKNKGQKLVDAKALKADFATKLNADGEAFNTAWALYRNKQKEASLGTQALADGLKAILKPLNTMMAIGRNLFKYDATLRKLFTIENVVDTVRSKHPATVSGFVRRDGKPLVGVLVQVENEVDKSAITDKQGRYEISIAGGIYSIHYSLEGMEPLTVKDKKVNAGKGNRLNVELIPVPVPAVPTLPISEPATKNPLINAVAEMLEKTSTNGMTNGAVV